MMAAERFVLLGLAQVRSAWFREISRWATTASLPIEYFKTMSVEEVRVRLRSGRGYSALLIDDSIAGLDRDLVDLALEAGCAVIIVDSGRGTASWSDLGASALLPSAFGRSDLLQVLTQVATPVARSSQTAGDLSPVRSITGYRGRLVAVSGAGGAGRSTVAMAVSQGLASDPRHAELVCLADLALHADQAMLHDARDVVPGIVELVEAHRGGTPTIDAVRSLTWRVDARGYHLLLGLRRHRDWTSIRPRAFEAALDGLRRGFRVVVVGAPGLHGLHGLLRSTRDLLEHGVSGDRILPVLNRSPRSPRARAELTRAFGDLLSAGTSAHGVPSPVHLAERRRLDEVLRDGTRLPDPWLAAVCGPVTALLDTFDEDRSGTATSPAPVAVARGSLGSWTDQAHDDDLSLGGG